MQEILGAVDIEFEGQSGIAKSVVFYPPDNDTGQ
jgi:hypothetical protein